MLRRYTVKNFICIVIFTASITLLCGCTNAKNTNGANVEESPKEVLVKESIAEISAPEREVAIEITEAETTEAETTVAETEPLKEPVFPDEMPEEARNTIRRFYLIHRAATMGYEESEAEKQIVSYLQVPEFFVEDTTWVGDWSELEWDGRDFSSFGCGICCLANIYNTILKPEVPILPDQMFDMTREQTDYAPNASTGAVSWGQLKKMCTNFGLNAEVKKKSADYAKFQEDVKNSITTLVLVCRSDNDKLWFYTRGHYVNIWEYDETTDTVFVSDPSGLFNRARVNLADIYNALKSASQAQYMTVNVVN